MSIEDDNKKTGISQEQVTAAKGEETKASPDVGNSNDEHRRKLLEKGHAVGSDANGWRIVQPGGWD